MNDNNDIQFDLNQMFGATGAPRFEQHTPYANPALGAADPEIAAHRDLTDVIVQAPPDTVRTPSWQTGAAGQERSRASFDSIIPKAIQTGKKYILRKQRVDKHTTVCKRVLLTPSMCTIPGCGFDIAVRNGFASWEDVPIRFRDGMLEALQEHVRQYHSTADDHIIDGSEISQSWLGGSSQKTF